MNEPKLTTITGGYLLEWDALTVHINRLDVHNDGRVTGDLQIFNGSKDKKAILLPSTQFNFSAEQTRNRMAKQLKEKYPKSGINWIELFDYLGHSIQEMARKGEPVQTLTTGGLSKPPTYIIDPFIIKNYPSAIFGDPGSSKSNIALVLATVMILPWEDNPMNIIAPANYTRCLYLDWETDEDTILWQLTKLQKGMNLPAIILEYRRCALPLSQDVEQIRQRIAEVKAEVVIIDSLGLAAGGDLNETKPALEFFSAFRQLKTTALILAHNAKNAEAKQRSIYGNMYYTAQMRNIWEIKKTQEEDSDQMSVALFHRKPPPFGKLRRPVGFKLSFTDDATFIEPEDPKTVSEFIQHMSLKSQLITELKHGKYTTKELSEMLDASEGTIRMELNRGKKYFKRFEDGWGLLTQGELT